MTPKGDKAGDTTATPKSDIGNALQLLLNGAATHRDAMMIVLEAAQTYKRKLNEAEDAFASASKRRLNATFLAELKAARDHLEMCHLSSDLELAIHSVGLTVAGAGLALLEYAGVDLPLSDDPLVEVRPDEDA